jgi:hypothetical protein
MNQIANPKDVLSDWVSIVLANFNREGMEWGSFDK